MNPSLLEIAGTTLFFIAVLHTFICSKLMHISHSAPQGSLKNSIFHFLGEVEVVFGLWAAVFFLFMTLHLGAADANKQMDAMNFTEPMFVFVIMVIASSRPILYFARRVINHISDVLVKFLKINNTVSDFFTVLVIGALSGSFITEPAAMTVCALLLNGMLESKNKNLIYFLIAVLFVNISVGGALTHFAAPPILMVAGKWNWDLMFVFEHFGLKSVATVSINALIFCLLFRSEIKKTCVPLDRKISDQKIPGIVIFLHLIFLVLVVIKAHHQQIFFGIFLFFLGLTTITHKYQNTLRFRESLLVAFFLGGIIVFGGYQKWWLQPLLTSMTDGVLFLGAIGLTAITDNAALTYLGSQVEGLTDASKYALVAGALAGGGLTIIANAPNAAGYSILNKKFGGDGLNPLRLFVAAIVPTLVAAFCYWILPH